MLLGVVASCWLLMVESDHGATRQHLRQRQGGELHEDAPVYNAEAAKASWVTVLDFPI